MFLFYSPIIVSFFESLFAAASYAIIPYCKLGKKACKIIWMGDESNGFFNINFGTQSAVCQREEV